tara:strand:+ start:764 stop:1417 length:654 start_codon:yes stop_codon:yes gene_type:complete
VTKIPEIKAFLLCETPDEWVVEAVKLENLPLLLADHANCEMKAAQTAQQLMWRYGVGRVGGPTENVESLNCFDLLNKMSRLAREELRHFEQVIAIMESRSIDYPMVSAGRYAAGMRKNLRKEEPGKLVDTLVIGAIIEARSCERFEKIAPFLDAELKKFYMSLLKSEARHFQDYLVLAGQVVSETEVAARAAVFLTADKELIESTDAEFRFHSGMPV